MKNIHINMVLLVIFLIYLPGRNLGYADEINEAPIQNAPKVNYDKPGYYLPPGVPRVVDTNGRVLFINHHFTSKAYQNEALRLLIQEANSVARELELPEDLPVTTHSVQNSFINPFGFAYAYDMVGTVTTEQYVYTVSCASKFNALALANYNVICQHLMSQPPLPTSELDTNSPLRLATNFLGRISIDIAGLQKNCHAHVAVSPYWNGLGELGEAPKTHFVPIYYVWWTYVDGSSRPCDSPGSVELHMPSKKLLQLAIHDQKYILRDPVVFTNMDILFPGFARIQTNYPVEPTIVTNF